MSWGTPMSGNVTALEGLHVTGKYRNRSMRHTCSRHAAWDPHTCHPRHVRRIDAGLLLAVSLFVQRLEFRLTTAHSENSQTERCSERYSCQFKNRCLAEMWSGSEEGSY